MEFCIQAWSPYLQKDIQCLEKIQRTTKMVYGLKDTAYDDRLNSSVYCHWKTEDFEVT